VHNRAPNRDFVRSAAGANASQGIGLGLRDPAVAVSAEGDHCLCDQDQAGRAAGHNCLCLGLGDPDRTVRAKDDEGLRCHRTWFAGQLPVCWTIGYKPINKCGQPDAKKRPN